MKINQLFPSHVAAQIFKVLLSPGNNVDKLIWEHELHGNFTVKSAYKFFMDLQQGNSSEEASNVFDRQRL